MKGTAVVTTQTTVTPVTVTEVKNGTVYSKSGGSIIVQTPEGFRSFNQGELDKRGVRIVKDGKPINLDDLNKGDKLTATIVTHATAQGHDAAGSAGDARSAGSRAAAGRRPDPRTRRRGSVGRSGCRSLSDGNLRSNGGNPQDAAEDRELVAADGPPEHAVARGRDRADDQTPRRQLAVHRFMASRPRTTAKSRAAASVLPSGKRSTPCSLSSPPSSSARSGSSSADAAARCSRPPFPTSGSVCSACRSRSA